MAAGLGLNDPAQVDAVAAPLLDGRQGLPDLLLAAARDRGLLFLAARLGTRTFLAPTI